MVLLQEFAHSFRGSTDGICLEYLMTFMAVGILQDLTFHALYMPLGSVWYKCGLVS